MLDDMLADTVDIATVQNTEPVLRTDVDYAQLQQAQKSATEEWVALGDEGQTRYNKKVGRYFEEKGVIDANSPEWLPAKNYSLIRRESDERLAARNYIETLPVGRLYFDQSLIELVENIENSEHIKELYRLRKRTVGGGRKSGINSDEAARLKSCMRQGRDLSSQENKGRFL